MALPSSGQITLSEIWSEYNSGATPATDQNISLGTLSANTADGGGDPDAMSEFYGLSSGPVFVANDNFAISTYTGNGGTQLITGPAIGKAAYFNGTSGRIATGLTLPADSTMSFSFWLKFDSNPSGNNYFFSDFDSAANNNSTRISLAITSSHGFRAWMSNGSSNWNTTNAIDLSHYLDKWFNLVVTLNGSTMKVYVNGGSPTTLTMSISFGTAGSRQLTIGRAGDLAGAYYQGHLDDIRIYTKELSAEEVGYIVNNTISSIPTGDLLAHYKLDGNANDAQGSYNGTASNITYTNNAAISNIGSVSQAANFLGTGTSKITTSADFDGTTAQGNSLSFWFNTTDTPSLGTQLFGSQTAQGGASSTSVVYIGNVTGAYTDESISFWDYNGSTTSVFLTRGGHTTYQDGEWHHCVIISSSTTKQIYIDGVSQTVYYVASGSATANAKLTDIIIGNNGSTYPYKGKISDVRIYSDTLTSTEVGYIYNNNTANIPTSNLVAHYKFNGNANDAQGSYNGTATNVGWVGSAFKPDLIWIKGRDNTWNHLLFDSVRGDNNWIEANTSDADATTATWFEIYPNGFNNNNIGGAVNANGEGFVAWSWKAGGAGVSNTDGTLTSTVSANQDAGFSIVKYTGNNTSGATAGHGLSSAPEMIIVKGLDQAVDWAVYHIGTDTISPEDYKLKLNTTDARIDQVNSWNDTQPNAATFTLGNGGGVNALNNDYIAYCFHSVTGYQKVGSYTISSSTTQTITTGFQPRFVMIRNVDVLSHFYIYDNQRRDSNQYGYRLFAAASNAETASSGYNLDFTSTGFTISGTGVLSWGPTYGNDKVIYLAIA